MTLTRLRQRAGDVVGADDRRAWSTSSSDAGELLAALSDRDWARANDLYGGAFLDGIALHDWGSELEEWVHATREYLAEGVQHGVLELAEAAAGRQEFAAAAQLARRAWRLPGAAPAEPTTLGRVHALLVAGRDLRAPEVRRELAEFGAAPSLTSQAARALWPPAVENGRGPREVLSERAVGAPAAAERVGTAGTPPTNLQPGRTMFVDREHELRRIDSILASREHRLLTVIGPGGIGKSRLAHEAAWSALTRGRYPDGVFLVAVDAVADAASLAAHVMAALGGSNEAAHDPWMRLASWLAPRRTLLVLDDLDGVPEAAPHLANLLASAPGLDLLLTARERLGLGEEQTLSLGGLAVPAPGEIVTWSEATAGGAVRLVVERTRALRAGLDLEPQLPQLLELCRVLDGSPLALELAAPWTRLVPCADILAQVTSDPAILAASGEDLPPRHRSLRAVFETSWTFLEPSERSVARRLAVFAGGFRRDAAAAVAGANLSTLGRLADAALLRGGPDGRFAIHPLVVAYCAEKLAAAPEELAAARARHRGFYLDWLSGQRDLLERGQQQRVFGALREEWPNVEAIVQFALAHRDLDVLAPLLRLVDVAYEARGALHDGVRLLEHVDALLRDDDRAVGVRARVLVDLGWFHHRLGAIEAGQAATRAGLALIGPTGDPALLARGTMNLGLAEGVLGRRAEAEPLLLRARDLANSSGDEGVLAAVLGSLGIHESGSGRHERAAHLFEAAMTLHERGGRVLDTIREIGNLAIAFGIMDDLPRSGALFERALAMAREIDFPQTMPFTLSNLGIHHARLGDHERARDLNLEAKAAAEATGQRPILVGILVNLTQAHTALGDAAAAKAASDEAIGLARDLAVEPLQLQALESRAELEAALERTEWAAGLLQVVLAHPAILSYEGSGAMPLWERLAARLGPDRADSAAAFGRMTTLPDALAWALAGGPPEAGRGVSGAP
jgi:tetratricopeptide (TPR) repeat protein